MKKKNSVSRTIFLAADIVILLLLSALCLYPFLHTIAVSFSQRSFAMGGDVGILPVGANLDSYRKLLDHPDFFNALWISMERIVLGISVNFLVTVLCAYPLSKENKAFRFRTVYAWFFVLTMLINGGLIPWYLTIKGLGMIDTIWALVIPGAVPVFSVMLLLNFFRNLPKELEEAALVDGARHWTILWKIFVPVSLPSLATITLFSFVGHWNSWFDGIILMNSTAKYPLQSYMQQFVLQNNSKFFSTKDLEQIKNASEQTVRSALIVLGTVPVIILFPFMQRFLKFGLVLGSVKQ